MTASDEELDIAALKKKLANREMVSSKKLDNLKQRVDRTGHRLTAMKLEVFELLRGLSEADAKSRALARDAKRN